MTALQCQLVALHHAQQMHMAIMLLFATARRPLLPIPRGRARTMVPEVILSLAALAMRASQAWQSPMAFTSGMHGTKATLQRMPNAPRVRQVPHGETVLNWQVLCRAAITYARVQETIAASS